MTEVDFAQVKCDDNDRDSFLESQRPFILKTASSVCKRHIDQSYDEYSIAFSAFNEAIDRFDERGSFLPFAAMVIRTRLIDYFRTNSKDSALLIDEDDEFQMSQISSASKQVYFERMESESRAMEIAQLTQELADWGITLRDLIKSSPKHKAKRKYINDAISIIEKDDALMEQLIKRKQLPLEILEKTYALPRKKLEPFRKYIIAGLIIRTGSYDYLRDYMR